MLSKHLSSIPVRWKETTASFPLQVIAASHPSLIMILNKTKFEKLHSEYKVNEKWKSLMEQSARILPLRPLFILSNSL